MKHITITKLYLVIATIILLSIFNICYAIVLGYTQNGL
jgi:hypothetical protein